MEQLKGIASIFPFFEQYPTWVRVGVATWIVAGAVLLGCLLLVPRSKKLESENGEESQRLLTDSQREEAKKPPVDSPNNHYQAALIGLIKLDCSKHRMASNPGIYTAERSACEALSEVRQNITILVAYRRVLAGEIKTIPKGKFSYKEVGSFVSRIEVMRTNGTNTPNVIALRRLVSDLEAASNVLIGASTREKLIKSQRSAEITIDDMIIGNGLLDWVVSYETKRHLSPRNYYSMGPFFDYAFPETMQGKLVVKHFMNSEKKPDVEYSSVFASYD